MARRNFNVDVYEMRDDPRTAIQVAGKSINLALSERGRHALRMLGLEDVILDKYSIKMRARMIHNKNGTKREIPYGNQDQYILSISRRFLNEMLITEAEKYQNVNMHFNHKLNEADLKNGMLSFSATTKNAHGHDSHADANNNYSNSSTDDQIATNLTHKKADLILGCDGAYSAIRQHLIKLLLLDYSQKYIEHGYLELCIPPTKSGDYAMELNYLHIWPRGQFMMIALPNLDRSFTVTLFMPFKIYEDIQNEKQLLEFFENNFIDSIPLIGR